MNIGIDIDEVLADFVGCFRQLVMSVTGKSAEHFPPPTEFNIAKCWNLSSQEWTEYFSQFKREGWFFDCEPIAGGKECIDRLRDHGFTVLLITARGFELKTDGKIANDLTSISTINWLDFHKIHADGLLFTNHKTLIDVDVMLEDAEHHLEAFRDRGKRAICFNQPHNQNWTGERVFDFKQFEELLINDK